MTVLRYRLNYASAYDFGIFSQMYYYMDKLWEPLTTCERDGLLSHFAVHLSPVFYVLLPFYKLVPRPETLLVLQALLVISGMVPLYLLTGPLVFPISRPCALAWHTVCIPHSWGDVFTISMRISFSPSSYCGAFIFWKQGGSKP